MRKRNKLNHLKLIDANFHIIEINKFQRATIQIISREGSVDILAQIKNYTFKINFITQNNETVQYKIDYVNYELMQMQFELIFKNPQNISQSSEVIDIVELSVARTIQIKDEDFIITLKKGLKKFKVVPTLIDKSKIF